MNTRQLLSVGIDIGTTTTQVIFSRLELVNRAAVSQVPRYEFIKRDISWQSPVFFTPVDKQGELKEAELEALILAQYRAAGIAPQAVDSGAIIITGESAKTRNARPAVMALPQSLGDFVVASAGPHLESVIAGHGAGAQTLSRQRMCRVLNIDIGGGTSNYVLFDAGNVSATACLNVGGRLLETDAKGRVVHAHPPGQRIVDALFGAGTNAQALTAGQLAQVARRMAALIVEVIDGTLSPLAQGLMQTEVLPAGVQPEVITLSGGVGECYRHQPADHFCFSDIGPLLATALHEHPRLREMNVQFPAQNRARHGDWRRGAYPVPVREHHLAGGGSIAAAQSAGGYPAGCRRSAERLAPGADAARSGPRGGRLRAGASRFTSGALRHLTDRN
ncbi:ethanolamine utilization protein EutA [Klebsiella pneumoniae subsp. rhinoscleromatis]|nr:ethanolamine utilization protein EutA [Klebsiella pneumoniae subsp. rhinoscleromatis]